MGKAFAGCFMLLVYLAVALLSIGVSVGFIAGCVWAVVKVLQLMGVL